MTMGLTVVKASLTTLHLSEAPKPRTFHDTTVKFLNSLLIVPQVQHQSSAAAQGRTKAGLGHDNEPEAHKSIPSRGATT